MNSLEIDLQPVAEPAEKGKAATSSRRALAESSPRPRRLRSRRDACHAGRRAGIRADGIFPRALPAEGEDRRANAGAAGAGF